jgi:hypothetical protein
MTSTTYQEAGDHPDRNKVDAIDATNSLLAYFPSRRMAAEEIRDSLLSISGELNAEMGGPGVFPEINWEVAIVTPRSSADHDDPEACPPGP